MDTISYLHVNGVNLEIADAQARTNVTDLQANKADKKFKDYLKLFFLGER